MECTLFLDAASPAVSVGLRVGDEASGTWQHAHDEAGVALFRSIDLLTRARGVGVAEITSVVFCEGPGSLLGVRLAAMALRTWIAVPREKPLQVFAYRSLELVAASLLAHGRAAPFHVIVDGRRATWNALSVDATGAWQPIRRRPATEVFPNGEAVFHPEGFPLWQTLPAGAQSVHYDPMALPGLAERFSLLRPVALPDAFMIEMPTYREWTPEHPIPPR